MHTEKGHRQRVKDRFRKEGLENFEEVHALELLLFYAIPRRDTKPVARRLLDQFGTLASVFEASEHQLQKVEGVGPNAATYIKLIHASGGYYLRNRGEAKTILNDINECGAYLINFFYGKQTEEVWLLCLDGKCKLLKCQRLSEGCSDAVVISPRAIYEAADSVKAASVILAHNHPGGIAKPSDADIAATRRLGKALAPMGVLLADHIVVAEDDFVSMRQTGAYCADDWSYMD